MFLKTCQTLSFLLGIFIITTITIMIITHANMIIIIFLFFMYLASCISSTQNIGHEVWSCSILSKYPTDDDHRDVDDGR